MTVDLDPELEKPSLHDHEVTPHHDDLDTDVEHPPLARLGRWSHNHRKIVIIAWAVLAIGLGVFAPRLEHALSGAMWRSTAASRSPPATSSTSSSAVSRRSRPWWWCRARAHRSTT